MNNNIEVETRSFISNEEHDRLLEFFKANAKLEKEDFQETHYFDTKEDLRIQKSNSSAKIWMKKGKIHDDWREEIEIKLNKEDFEKAKEIFNTIGLKTNIKWLRNRNQFNWDEIKVCLDYTKGYGFIIELEKMSSEDQKEKVFNELQEKLKELGVKISTKDEFETKFNYYKENWKELIGE
jgi:predicted adenylyl cyclase CyaB